MPQPEFPIVDPTADTDPKLRETSYADPSDPRRVDMSELRLVSEPGPSPQIGTVIGDVYTVDGELGSGAMGIVLSATDRVLGRKVAIKLIRSNLRADDFRERFMLEARAMALVSHPNVVTIHAFGEHEGNPFMVMELVEGQSLDNWLVEHSPHPDIDEALRILNQVCLGVSAIHAAGTLHRDLKPSNVLLDGELRARVSDLGLAVQFHDGAMNKEVVGTPGYIAPEIHFDVHVDGGATPQSDLYSLGCMAFELLTGEPPYSASDDLGLAVLHATAAVPAASDVRRDLPHAFDQVLRQALAKDPKQRTQSVELFRRALIEARNDSLEPVRILVAEDDQDFRELLQIVLTQEFPGADVECVDDGRKAIEAFDRQPASVTVLDLQMPEMDGMAVTALLRARPQAQQVPIIVLSASGGSKEWQLLASLGADRFLVKPVNLDDLISTIRRVTRERSSSSPAPASGRVRKAHPGGARHE
jgi:eukaryotic-like serine/threonine-protein kinase